MGKRIAFPTDDADQCSYVRDAAKLGWVTAKCGASLTGYDFASAIRVWLKEEGFEELSVCEASLGTHALGVGSAHAFLSHVQLEPLKDTLAAMESELIEKGSNDKCFFVDYVGLRQCQSDFHLPKVMQAIAKIGTTVMCLHSRPETYLERSFCVFEVFATINANKALLCFASGQFLEAMSNASSLNDLILVDVIAAQTRDEKDKRLIDDYISATVGHRVVNEKVRDAMIASINDALTRLVLESELLQNKAALFKEAANANRGKWWCLCGCRRRHRNVEPAPDSEWTKSGS